MTPCLATYSQYYCTSHRSLHDKTTLTSVNDKYQMMDTKKLLMREKEAQMACRQSSTHELLKHVCTVLWFKIEFNTANL